MSNKVLVLTPDLKVPGGVSNYYEALGLHSVNGIKYFFVSNDRKESFGHFVWRLIKNYFFYAKTLFKSELNLVHINPSLNFNSFIRDALFLIIAHGFNKKTLVFFHGWSDEFENKIKKNLIYRWIFSKSFKKCKHIVVLSNLFKEKLIALGCNPNRTHFWVESTVADTSFLDGFSINEKLADYKKSDKIKILFLSRIEEEKGVYIALEAFEKLQTELSHKKLELIIAGDGNALADAKKMTKLRNIQNVTFTGYIKENKKKKVLHEAHLFLFPTYYGEGMPTNILEAMLYGMPIISRYNAGIADAVSHGENGFLTDSKDANDFAEMMKFILSDDSLYNRIVRVNHQKALKNYSSEVVRERILNIYKLVSYGEHAREKAI
ncbi:glycosyltransferase family 4 protein [Catalinimonas sp. 4WD22]|uniref:glycosyltransferase family 4 protein n=1 Tax=Catalinimonas locisalis TaxID=3133978 RepID=UPI003100CBDD